MNKTKVYNNVHIIIDTTYSHYYRCVYVVYPNMITIPGAICSLRTRGGGLSQGWEIPHFPWPEGPFFQKSKEKLMRKPQDYKKYIVINIVY